MVWLICILLSLLALIRFLGGDSRRKRRRHRRFGNR